MEFFEYPKALYLSGEMCAVSNPEEETAQRAAGFDDWEADYAKQKPSETKVESKKKSKE